MLTYLIYCISYICATLGNHRKLNGQSLTHRIKRLLFADAFFVR